MQNLVALCKRHREPLLFGAVGIFVMLMSYVELWVMQEILHISAWIAYLIQVVISVEANFLLNHFVTYALKRRNAGFVRAFLIFHASRITVTIPVNMVLYPVLSEYALPAALTAIVPSHPGLLDYTFIAAQTTCLALAFGVNFFVSTRIYNIPDRKGRDGS